MSTGRSPRLAEWILRLLSSRKYKIDLLGDTEEEYRNRRTEKGRLRANLWYLSQIIIPIPYFIRTSVFWALSMFMNYMKIAVRIMMRNKIPSLINTTGLAVGMACFILTVVWVQYEFSFDRFHSKADRIVRTLFSWSDSEGIKTQAGSALPMGKILKESYPEVVDFTYYRRDNFYFSIQQGDVVSYDNRVAYADPGFLKIFDFHLIEGNPDSALVDLNSVIITRKTAAKYFRQEDPMGRALLFKDKKQPMYVRGIMEDVPENSHIQFDMILPTRALDSLYDIAPEDRFWDNWRPIAAYGLYIELEKGASAEEFSRKISGLLKKHDPESKYTLSVQPLKEVHFPRIDYDYFNVGRMEIDHIYIFLLISFVVLLTACINFMSLSTARALRRAREVGIRKVNGAQRLDIVKQFMGESFVHSFVALLGALLLAWVFLPTLRAFSGRTLSLDLLQAGPLVFSILGIAFVTGIVSGIYPAFFASAYDPVKVIKKAVESRKYSFFRLRQVLVSLQFICATVLIIITLVIFAQLRFLKNKDLGYNHDNLVVFNVGPVRQKLEVFKQELLKNPNITHVTAGAAPTWGIGGHRFGKGEGNEISWEGKSGDETILMDMYFADYDYLKTYELTLLEGRWFSREYPTDKNNYVLTESAVKLMNLDDPLGKRFFFGKREGTIIGVVKDFNAGTLRNEIYPGFFMCVPNLHVTVRILPQDTRATLDSIEAVWKKFVPERPLNYRFLDERLAEFYTNDRKLGRIVTNYTILSLLISCLGLFGLVAFMAEHKTKEIGIRKVLGAPVSAIIGMISREFILQILAANLIALPLGYWIASSWLRGFAFNIGFNAWIYVAAAVSVFLFAYMTVGYKTLKVALMNPVNSLRYE